MVKDCSFVSEAEESRSGDSFYSDKIDSDIEAQLYGSIHHDANTSACETTPKEEFHNVNNNSNSEKSTDLHYDSTNRIAVETDEILVKKFDRFSSDFTFKSNLYTNFETSPEKCMIQKKSSKNKKKKLKKSRKRKSDVTVGSSENIQVNFNSESNSSIVQSNNEVSNGRKRTKTEVTPTATPNKNDLKIQTAKESTSDSDSSSVILTDPDSPIQTNIEEMIVLSSDDDSSLDESELKFSKIGNASFLSTPVNSTSKDPWHVNEDDLYRKRRSSSRYHEKASLYCSNCNQRGHTVKFCTLEREVKCAICGGKHRINSCRNIVCHKCSHLGHIPRNCSYYFKGICDLCKMTGHLTDVCPDLWRRYHLTTKVGRIVKGKELKQDTPLYCFNCGREGHYGPVCREHRMDRRYFPKWTSVISYSSPEVSIPKFRGEHPRDFPVMQEQFSHRQNRSLFVERLNQTFPQNGLSPVPRVGLPPVWARERPRKKKKKKKANTSLNSARKNERVDLYFPRTPKQNTMPSVSEGNGSKASRRSCNGNLQAKIRRKQTAAQIELRARLGLPPNPENHA